MRTAPASKLAWLTVGLLWFAFLVNYIDRQVVFSMFPVLQRELRFTNAELGLVGTVFLWVYSACIPFAGRLADMLRRERLVVASLVLWSLATLGTGLSSSVTSLLFWRAAMGISESLFMPAALGLIAVWHGTATRSRALALFATGQFAGVAAGGWYGGWTAEHIGWRTGFLCLAAVGCGWALVLWAALRPAPATNGPEYRRASPYHMLRSRIYLALGAAFFTFCAILWILMAWLATYIYERYHLSLAESGFRATLFLQAGSAAGVLCGGWLGDRFAKRLAGGRFYVGGFGLLVSAPFAYALLAADSLAALEWFSVAFGVFGGLFIANLYAAAYDVVSERNYGFAAGMLNFIGGLAGGAAMLAAGLLKQSVGMAGLVRWGAFAATVAGLILIITVAARFRCEHNACYNKVGDL